MGVSNQDDEYVYSFPTFEIQIVLETRVRQGHGGSVSSSTTVRNQTRGTTSPKDLNSLRLCQSLSYREQLPNRTKKDLHERWGNDSRQGLPRSYLTDRATTQGFK